MYQATIPRRKRLEILKVITQESANLPPSRHQQFPKFHAHDVKSS